MPSLPPKLSPRSFQYQQICTRGRFEPVLLKIQVRNPNKENTRFFFGGGDTVIWGILIGIWSHSEFHRMIKQYSQSHHISALLYWKIFQPLSPSYHPYPSSPSLNHFFHCPKDWGYCGMGIQILLCPLGSTEKQLHKRQRRLLFIPPGLTFCPKRHWHPSPIIAGVFYLHFFCIFFIL